MLEVVELLDGPVGGGAEGIFSEAAAAARAVLGKSTIADVVEPRTARRARRVPHLDRGRASAGGRRGGGRGERSPAWPVAG